MIIGNGLLAHTFYEFTNNHDVLIFASGVSNSSETDPWAYNRELNLLSQFENTSLQIIYFSTVSVYDPELEATPYIIHKRQVELKIVQNYSKYLIFRLPIVVSNSENANTLTNFIYNKILKNEPVPVFLKACRYLMDVQDISSLVRGMITSNQFHNEIIDINFNNAIQIQDLLLIYEQVLKIQTKCRLIDAGGCYTTKNTKFLNYCSEINYILPQDYIQKTIQKYYAV